ncbi:hypothetical protein [Thiobacillus sedimenti]|uniref:Kazal-like domain-containing protein n=1 Tax=Thiobacillus sedimenti TaxID=3110231 RepID=A0ABZ1CHM6_9PROT|nr:hypothetical protein [Thiobacillus sp. SCUT-2]WRS38894.1 hypothetical protein VA613_12925 [Thiobacillus sp. SCUT-2]
MIRALAAAALLLTLSACAVTPAPSAGHRKPAPPGPPPPPMPDIPLVCPSETRLCPDGHSVGRNPANECEFDPCAAAPTPTR